MGENPKVSVITPVFNSGKYLRETIESILAQTFSDFEYIIVYDKSDDNTLEIIEDYEKKDTRIKIIINEERKGLSYAWERGLLESHGEWIAYVDSDDLFSPLMLEKTLYVAEKYGVDYVLFEEYWFADGSFIDKYDTDFYKEPFELSAREIIYKVHTRQVKAGLGVSGKIAKRSLYMSVDYSLVKNKYPRAYFDDCYLPHMLIEKAGKVVYCPMILKAQRYHTDSASHNIIANEHLMQHIFAGAELIPLFKRYNFSFEFIRSYYETLMRGGIKVYYSGFKVDKCDYMNRAKQFFDSVYKDYKKIKKDRWYIFYMLFSCFPRIWCKTFGKFYFEVLYNKNWIDKTILGVGRIRKL